MRLIDNRLQKNDPLSPSQSNKHNEWLSGFTPRVSNVFRREVSCQILALFTQETSVPFLEFLERDTYTLPSP